MTVPADGLGRPAAHRGARHGHHEWSSWSTLANSVAELLADLTGGVPAEIPPLYESVDRDAVEAVLLDPDGVPREMASISFVHLGYELTIHGTGEIVARSPYPTVEP